MRALGGVVLGTLIAVAGLGCAGPLVAPTDDGLQAHRPIDLPTALATRNLCDELWAQYLSTPTDEVLDQLIANGCQRAEEYGGTVPKVGVAPSDGERLAAAIAVVPLLQQHFAAEIAEKDPAGRKVDSARTDMLMSELCSADRCSSSTAAQTIEGKKLDAARPFALQFMDLITSVRAKGTPNSLAADTAAVNLLAAKMCTELGCKVS